MMVCLLMKKQHLSIPQDDGCRVLAMRQKWDWQGGSSNPENPAARARRATELDGDES